MQTPHAIHSADTAPAGEETSPLRTDSQATLRRLVRHGTLPQLAAFAGVMRLGSVTRAADALHMAPSTVSGHLRKLSDVIGLPLFRCDGRHMWPTPAAQTLAVAAAEVFDALERADQALAGLRQGPRRGH